MSPMRSPRAQRLARQVLLLPVLVAALLVAVVPAAGGPKRDHPGKGAATVEAKKPYGAGHGRKIK